MQVRSLAQQQMGVKRATNEELNQFMASFDADGDGTISFEEYLTVILGNAWSIEGHDGEWWDAEGASAEGGAGDVNTSIVYRRHNGKRQAATDKNGGSQFLQSVSHTVRDARALPAAPTVDSNGFALRMQSTGMSKQDFSDNAMVTSTYYNLCEEVVKEETGASRVTCFYHSIHTDSGTEPAHCDYTVKSAFDLDALDRTFSGRIAVMSVLRNIDQRTPILNGHIALCDAKTLVCPDDFVFYNQQQGGGVTELFHMDPHNHHNHRWMYFSNQTADEALIFKHFDSDPESTSRYTFTNRINVNNVHADFRPEMVEVKALSVSRCFSLPLTRALFGALLLSCTLFLARIFFHTLSLSLLTLPLSLLALPQSMQ